ncbi:YwqG family protein [Chondrinema litorale]|uniref:YwqG family protein n=1 Tax=Chondrinema litorale TaxID=2994555 RepID=UPI0025434A13|nr:YwqG family protein [Chondrinema litorale]UZR98091.1 YwqG family protein [Chondrinema litorale]
MSSHFDQYKAELEHLGLSTIEDLEKLAKPLIKTTTKMEVQKASRPPENSQLDSHFGGQPYFEIGESWPTTDNGVPLQFIFQVFNKPDLELPKSIELIQFFYDFEESPWDSTDDGLKIKIYKKLNKDKINFIEQPEELPRNKYCEIKFIPTETLPDWDGIDSYETNASKLSCILNEDKPWESYGTVVKKLIGEQDYQSQLGGYPRWIQADAAPQQYNKPLPLLFQIDSEDNANIMWGDTGVIYVFYDEVTDRTEFTLQCL